MKYIIPILLLYALNTYSFKIDSLPEKSNILSMYEEVAKRSPTVKDVQGFSINNLAWYESYWLQSYVVMYRATNNYKYLFKALRDVDIIMARANASQHTFIQSDAFSKGVSREYVVHAGMILYPILMLLDEMEKNDFLYLVYMNKIINYTLLTENMVNNLNKYWHVSINGKLGWYEQPSLYGNIVYNQQNTLGDVFILLWSLTDDDKYKVKATRLARFFKEEIKIKGNQYVWSISSSFSRQPEDLSHASLNVGFMVLCYQHGIIFDQEDISYLINTFGNLIRMNVLPENIAGTGRANKMMQLQIGRWGVLSPYSIYVRNKLYVQLLKAFKYNAPTAALSLSYLLLPIKNFKH